MRDNRIVVLVSCKPVNSSAEAKAAPGHHSLRWTLDGSPNMRALALQRRTRPGSSSQTEVSFLDLVVSGRSLYDELCRRGYDYVSCLGWLTAPYDDEARARLLLESPCDLPGNRSALYICPECGDLGCGAISVRISREGNQIVWAEFGYENNYEKGFLSEERLGPFTFTATEYLETLRAAA